MISYNFSVQGKSHIEKGTVCQDYSKVIKLNAGWHLGVAADGVGSALHSEIGSRTAVESLCDYCQRNIDACMTDEQMEDMLRQGYEYAFNQVQRYADSRMDDIAYYDTTMSAALYNGRKVIYGHSGDGGILVRLYDGSTVPITTRQKGADGTSVMPLRAGAGAWAFGAAYDVAGVLLLTDGMLDGVFQPPLLNLPSDMIQLAKGDYPKNNVYITASEFFLNPNSVYKFNRIKDKKSFLYRYIAGELNTDDEDKYRHCLMNAYKNMLGPNDAADVDVGLSGHIYAVMALGNVTDDKTVVGMMNEDVSGTMMDKSYYFEPDWKENSRRYNALLYGGADPGPSTPEPEEPKTIELNQYNTPRGFEPYGSREETEMLTYARDNRNMYVDDRPVYTDEDNEPVRTTYVPKRKKTGLILAICIPVVLILLVVGFFFFKKSKVSSNPDEAATVSDEVSVPTATTNDADEPATYAQDTDELVPNKDDMDDQESIEPDAGVTTTEETTTEEYDKNGIELKARLFFYEMCKDFSIADIEEDDLEEGYIIEIVDAFKNSGILDDLKEITGYDSDESYDSPFKDAKDADESSKDANKKSLTSFTEEIKNEIIDYVKVKDTDEDGRFYGDESVAFINQVKKSYNYNDESDEESLNDKCENFNNNLNYFFQVYDEHNEINEDTNEAQTSESSDEDE